MKVILSSTLEEERFVFIVKCCLFIYDKDIINNELKDNWWHWTVSVTKDRCLLNLYKRFLCTKHDSGRFCSRALVGYRFCGTVAWHSKKTTFILTYYQTAVNSSLRSLPKLIIKRHQNRAASILRRESQPIASLLLF